ncbi:AraC family transcriptional regulator [Nocardioides renjunii]|uniref:AraC family transcriptional regulator n=1 Tax=Nocardioides renjunii TaxID=3095075 RepID=UPI002AFF0234|nr:AraC family transcriptional regulator [Nocardioides sp. S-34]WQQ22178.1 AraC family transcriptional regulator [Nocardioides sp. S-34]
MAPRQPSPQEDTNRRMLRARDEMDRRYAEPLDVPTLAAIAHLSASQFGRVFKEVYGETPHRYLQRRRVERAMTLLRQTDRPVTDVAWDVGFASLGTFSRTFSNIVGCSPTEFRARHAPVAVPSCFIAAWTRPRGGSSSASVTPPTTAVSEKHDHLVAD